MVKIVILGSCRFVPYSILAPYAKTIPDPAQAYAYSLRKVKKQKESQREAVKVFHPAIDECDEVWIYAPDGIGEHVKQDIDYAKSKGKKILMLQSLKEEKKVRK